MNNFSKVFTNPLPSFNPIDLLIGVAGAVVIKLIIYVQYKVGTEELWVLKAKYQAKGYTKTMMIRLKHSNRFKQYTYWTETGREFLYNFLKDRGILPKSEQILQEKISKGIMI